EINKVVININTLNDENKIDNQKGNFLIKFDSINDVKKENLYKSNQNNNNDISYNNINFLSNDNIPKQTNNVDNRYNINNIENEICDYNNKVKDNNVKNNNGSCENIQNNYHFSQINEESHTYMNNVINNTSLFYKYPLIVDDENQNINNREQTVEDVDKEKVEESNKREKRKIGSLFDDDNNDYDDTGKKEYNNNTQFDLQLIDELKIEAIVSFSNNLICNTIQQSEKKNQLIIMNILLDSLFYYEDNKVSEEWLMDNDIKIKKNQSEAKLVNTLLNANSLSNGNIASILTRNNSINTNNNGIIIVDDNNIRLTEKDVKKRKINKKISSNYQKINMEQIKDEFLISDSDDEEDDKFKWN
ncbi:hypothetical protein PIROE2DRAFT_7847, partial [Piromyces sp. E2]